MGQVNSETFAFAVSLSVRRGDRTRQGDLAAKAPTNDRHRTIQRAAHDPTALMRRVGKRRPIHRQAIALVAVNARVNVVTMAVRMRIDEDKQALLNAGCRSRCSLHRRKSQSRKGDCREICEGKHRYSPAVLFRPRRPFLRQSYKESPPLSLQTRNARSPDPSLLHLVTKSPVEAAYTLRKLPKQKSA